jgi:hypothetical protein
LAFSFACAFGADHGVTVIATGLSHEK